jgi:hypothetical protein
MVYSRAERVFILEQHFPLKQFPTVYEAFSYVYPDKEVPNKTTIYRLVTTFQDRMCLWQVHCTRLTLINKKLMCGNK